MSVQALTWAMDAVTGSPSHKLVLMNLADRAGFEWECWPSQATIARQTEMSERTVRRLLAELERLGFLTRRHRYDHEGHRTSDMIVLTPTGQSDRKAYRSDDAGLPVIYDTDYRSPVAAKPSLEPSVEPKNPPTPQGGAIVPTDEFEIFWNCYPRRVAKPAAFRAYKAAVKKPGVTPLVLLDGVAAWIGYWSARSEPEFVPHPSTWLNQERWNDAPPPLATPKIKTNAGVDILRQIRAEEGR
jgi:DNA-binding MarR family transcriptional regulator